MNQALQSGPQQLSRIQSPVTWAEVERKALDPVPFRRISAHPDSDGRRPPSTVRRAAIALVAVAAMVTAAVVWRPDRPVQQVRTNPGPRSTDERAPSPAASDPATTSTTIGTTTTVPAIETSRSGPVTALTDTEYLVWGGEDGTSETDRNDGFAVDLDSGAVTAIPPAPVRRSGGTQGAWTGIELVVWSAHAPGCGSCRGLFPEAAAWNPDTRTWRTIEAPPLKAVTSTQAAVWTGALVVTVTSDGVAAAYDPRTDRWADLPTVPMQAAGRASLVWTGSEVVYWAPAFFSGPFPVPSAVLSPTVVGTGHRAGTAGSRCPICRTAMAPNSGA